ncbi:MAG: glycoside hydrolase family 2 TIM barrel-domain containing protein [Solirubrobacteraceae bacterium]|nr:glycoside hydrolase family 2 TIM barrel-domain containing protein [Solirubrobacteraceae bacterium]
MHLLSAFAVAVVLALALPQAAPASDPPGPVTLSQGWQHAKDPGDIGAADNWQSGVRGHGWEPVTIPHVADARTDAALFPGSVAWYRVTFKGPQTADGMGWAIRFEAVRRAARVWLNGRELGVHRDPYTPFEMRAHGLRPGEANTLVVRADYRRTPGWREGWWNWGGITRLVSLVPRGPVVMQDAGLLPRRVCVESECAWNVLVDGWLENASDIVQQPTVAVRLRSPDGEVSEGTTTPRALRPGERVRVRFTVPVRGDPKVWSPEQPDRYTGVVTTRTGGRAVQVDERRIGLRTVEVVDGMLRLNDRVTDLRGASIHEDIPGRGPAMTDADVENTVDELKALGVNITRAHYVLDRRLLERFDEEGILVWNQAPVYHRDVHLRTPGQRSYELDVLRNTILAARNHPSVITHSVANELAAVPDEQRTSRIWMRNAAELARDLDPTLPVSIDILTYPGIAHQTTYDAFDMLGLNSYYGWYEGKPNRSVADIDDLAPYLRAMREKYPAKALVITEFGAEADVEGPADVKQTYAFQTQYLKRNLDIIDRLGFMGGAIYWTAREFAVKPNWDGGAAPLVRDSIHNKGLISYDGKIKPAFSAAQQAFKATPLYRDDPAAVARAELSGGGSLILRALLFIGVFGSVAALLALYAMCLRDIWRSWQPRGEGQVVELPSRRVA